MGDVQRRRPENTLFIPNSFQHMNFYVDWLSYYLTSDEEKVLNKAIREILGWHNKIESRQGRIALSVFVDGKTDQNGEQLCLGCGLSLNTVRGALAELDSFGILVKVGSPTQNGQLFEIQIDPELLNWEALEARREAWDNKNKARIKKATRANPNNQGVPSDGRGTVARYPGVPSHGRSGVPSHDNKETQIETQIETQTSTPSERKENFDQVRARALRGTLTTGEDEVERSDLATYIGQQMYSTLPQGDCKKLAMTYTEQTTNGKRVHPSPDDLWKGNPLFKEYVIHEIGYYQKQNGSLAQRRKALVNIICAYKSPSGFGFLDWIQKTGVKQTQWQDV